MKQKTIGIFLITLVSLVLLTWYAVGDLYNPSFNGLDVYLASPVNNTITKNITVIFNCTAATNLSTGLGNITLLLGQASTGPRYNQTNTSALSGNIKNASSMFTQFNLSEGLWFWNCQGSNSTFGDVTNSSNTSRVIIIDTTAPAITFTGSTPANDSYIIGRDSTQNNSLNISVALTELYPVNVTFNVSMLNGTGYTWNYTTSTAGIGTLNLTMLSLSMTFNSTNLSSPPDDNTTFKDAVLYIQVAVSDNASNKGTATRTITTDSKNPVLWTDSPLNGTVHKANATSLAVRFNISMLDTNINASATVYRLGIATGLTNTSFTQNTSEKVNTSQTITFSMNATDQFGGSTENGSKIIYFIAKDKAGREIVNYTRIYFDFAPVISLSYPTHMIWTTTGANILFNFTAINNDTATSSLDSCTLWGNLVGANSSYIANKTINSSISSAAVAGMGSYNGTTIPVNISLNLLQGNYTWAVRCNDTTGNNIYTANRTLYVDTANPVPTLTATESTGVTIALGSTVNLACTATDTLDPSPSASLTQIVKPDGTTTLSPSAAYSSIDQTGTYTASCSSTDESGRSATTTASFIAQYASQGGTSNGGAGGTVITKTQIVTIPSIQPGSPNTVALADPAEYALKQIEIDVLNAVSNVQITVSKLSGKPSGATSEAASSADKVYKYIEVKKTNMKDSDIKKATMEFQVTKSWISALGATKEQVTLKKLSGTSWEKLPTTITDENDDYVYYKASAPGLSYFAVTVEEEPAVLTEEEMAQAEEEMVEEAEELPPVEEQPSKKWLWVTAVAILMAIAAGIGYTVYTKKRR